jgi:hypothetical protein
MAHQGGAGAEPFLRTPALGWLIINEASIKENGADDDCCWPILLQKSAIVTATLLPPFLGTVLTIRS